MNKKSSLIIILILGLTIKIIGLIYKIISTRLLGLEGMKVIASVMPILGLSLTLSSFQTGVVTNQNIASNIKTGKTKIRIILLSSLKITLTSSTIISLLLLLSFPLYNFIYNDKSLYHIILLFIPLIYICNISSLLKAYLEAYNNFNYIYITNTIEMILKLILMIIVLTIFNNYSIYVKIFVIYIAIIISEIVSLLILLNKIKYHINKESLKTRTNKYEYKLLKQAFPLTIDSLISSISMYILPFVYYYALSKINISSDIGITYYTLVTTYAIPLLICGQFPIITIAKINFPLFSKEIDNNKCSYYFEKALILSLIISTTVLILCIFYPYEILKLLYNDTTSYKIVIFLAPIYFFLYLDPLFIMILQSRKKEKLILFTTIISQMLNIILVYFLSKTLLFNTSGYIIAITISSIIKFIILLIISLKIIKYKPNIKLLLFIILNIIYFIFNYLNHYYITFVISTIIFFPLYLLLYYFLYKNK